MKEYIKYSSPYGPDKLPPHVWVIHVTPLEGTKWHLEAKFGDGRPTINIWCETYDEMRQELDKLRYGLNRDNPNPKNSIPEPDIQWRYIKDNGTELPTINVSKLQRDLVRGMIPEFRKHGFFEGESDEAILAKPFPEILAAYNMGAWLNLLPDTDSSQSKPS